MEVEPPASSLGAGAVCCMCGDRGLPHELLRCKLCRVRLQHRYCSDLYPRATAYRRCNWCLTTEPAQVQPLARAAAGKTTDKRKAAASADAPTSSSEEEGGVCRQSHEAGCATTRSKRSAAEVGQPVKKQKVGDRVALPLPPSPGATAKGNNGSKKQMADERAGLPSSPGVTAKGNGTSKQKAVDRETLPPSPGTMAKDNNSNSKHMGDDRATLPPSLGASAKGNNGKNKHKADDRATLPPSLSATSKADKHNGSKKPMQAWKLTRPGKVKVRRYRLLAEVISC